MNRLINQLSNTGEGGEGGEWQVEEEVREPEGEDFFNLFFDFFRLKDKIFLVFFLTLFLLKVKMSNIELEKVKLESKVSSLSISASEPVAGRGVR